MKQDIKIMGRLRKEYGGKIEDFYVNRLVGIKIPDRWEFISKVDVPEYIKKRYAMLYKLTN